VSAAEKMRPAPRPLTGEDVTGMFIDPEGLRLDTAEEIDFALGQLRLALAPMKGKRPVVKPRHVRRAFNALLRAREAVGCLKRDMRSSAKWIAKRVDEGVVEKGGAS
jgi:hypothetical protein